MEAKIQAQRYLIINTHTCTCTFLSGPIPHMLTGLEVDYMGLEALV